MIHNRITTVCLAGLVLAALAGCAAKAPATSAEPAPATPADAPAAAPSEPTSVRVEVPAAEPTIVLAEPLVRGVSVEVLEHAGDAGMVEFRRVSVTVPGLADRWRAVDAGRVLTGIVEVRSGPASSATLSVESGPLVRVERLASARLSRVALGSGAPAAEGEDPPTRAAVEILRGSVLIVPRDSDNAPRSVAVRTPDGEIVINSPTLVSYDPVRGTRQTPASPPATPPVPSAKP
jgi:hypothetical protein